MTSQIYNHIQSSKSRLEIFQKCKNVEICAVTKNRSIEEIANLLSDLPDLEIIGENRWPACEQAFQEFKKHPTTGAKLSHHFIGPLQSNKIKKILPLVDCIQSVDSAKLLDAISKSALELDKNIDFLIQVNISHDSEKSGIEPGNLRALIEHYLKEHQGGSRQKIHLCGLMTIGAQTEPKERQIYFAALRQLFDKINSEYFRYSPLKTLSMGMSEDFELAIKEGSTMVRLGSCLF